VYVPGLWGNENSSAYAVALPGSLIIAKKKKNSLSLIDRTANRAAKLLPRELE